MSFARITALFLVAAASVAACASQVPMPTTAQVASAKQQWPGTTEQELAEGRTLYVQRCAGCHVLPLPETKTAEQWPHVIDEMADRAHLTKEERTRVLHYLMTVSPPGEKIGAR